MAQPARSRTRLAREERREQIVIAAAEVFEGRDPVEVTFEEIADAAGVSRALVYNYFGDRHGLIEAVYRRHVSQLQSDLTEALTDLRGHRPRLATTIRVHVEFAARNPTAYRYAAAQVPFAQLPVLVERNVQSIADRLGGGWNARLVARGVLSAVQSMVLYWLEHDGTDAETAAEVITSFVWTGLRGSPTAAGERPVASVIQPPA